jgi:hypothetical protein
MPNPDGQEREPTRDEVEANRNEFAKLLIRLRERRISGTGEGDPVKVAVEVRDAARAGLVAALAAREEPLAQTHGTAAAMVELRDTKQEHKR